MEEALTNLSEFLYFERWNFHLFKPILDAGWISREDAEERYGRREPKTFGVVAGRSGVGEGAVIPAFILMIAPGRLAFSSYFFNRAGSVSRVLDYEHVDGRLFMHSATDYVYVYPDQAKYRVYEEATKIFKTTYRPDGYGTLRTKDSSTKTSLLEEFQDVPIEHNWMPIPEFGDWENLINPEYHTRTDDEVQD